MTYRHPATRDVYSSFFFFFFFFPPSDFKNVDVCTRHTHKYKVNMYRLYNGVKNNNKQTIVRTGIYKQSYTHNKATLTIKQ